MKGTTDLSVPQANRRAYRTFLFCLLCLASFLSLLIAQLVLGKRLDQEGKCLELMSFFRILNTPREFFVGSRQKLINMLRSVQNIHVETAYGGLSQVHWPSRSSSPWSLAVRRTCTISSRARPKMPERETRAGQSPISSTTTSRSPRRIAGDLSCARSWLGLRRCAPSARNNSIYVSH